ncbi:mediator of RNA polymerase II transcription subunit 32-like [Phoenix dactylifera]|uniref:Mediator of RNA polymerase II transcription subunit 32-like n=1 Tax=Phoenix dactylifera TaxID=42345 RepID=A0A8B7CTL2_PHODC|nr:mediator of RNA polymerase II transcription subunit 32-like [Phoenix dactylifera]
MESKVDGMSDAYDNFVAAATRVLQANEAAGGRRTVATEVALENFKNRWEVFKATCDRVEEIVEEARRRIAPEYVVDVAGGMAPAAAVGAARVPPFSVPQLEQALHVVHSMAADLRQASGGSAAPSAAVPPSDAVPPSEEKDE